MTSPTTTDTLDAHAIAAAVKHYIMEEFLPGEDPDELDETTPLITGGILDSISTVQLVAFLEERYAIAFESHEMSADYLNTLDEIAATVQTKRAQP